MPRPKKNKQAGEAFKKLLEEKNFSQYKLVQVTGLDQGLISRLANGYTASPKPATLEKIAEALEVDLGELTKIFTQSPVRSHSAEVPPPQESAQEETPSKNTDFVGREEAIALPALENEIVVNPDPQALQLLINHIAEECWWEVFLTTSRIMEPADNLLLLMKQHIDTLVAFDKELQQFLDWISQKSNSVKTKYKTVAVRTFYFILAFDGSRVLDLIFCKFFNLGLTDNLLLDSYLDDVLRLSLEDTLNAGDFIENLDYCLAYAIALDYKLVQPLQNLKKQLPNRKQLGKWWQSNRKAWANKLRDEIVKYRNIGHEWQFSNQQRLTLEQYYDTTLLLVDCLNNASDVTPEIRSHIEDTLLLPIAEIEKRRLGD